jgi:hypothetical protein
MGISGIGGLAGCSSINSLTGSSEPEVEVSTIEPSNSLFTKIVLYENGFVDITLVEDHGDWERIGLTHTINDLDYSADGEYDDAYAIWDAPQFAGPITKDVKSPIQSNGPYPSQSFKMKLLPPEGENIINIGGGPDIDVEFDVPDSYLSGD